VLGVHPNTVLRALRMLLDDGLLEVGRGRAITVAGTPERGIVATKMKELIDLARRNGYRRDELLAMTERMA
jgi:GntR family transcriptional regulator